MFMCIKYGKELEMINLDNITELKCDYNVNILAIYKDGGVWSNWTFVDGGALTNAYNQIVEGLLAGKKLVTISEGLE